MTRKDEVIDVNDYKVLSQKEVHDNDSDNSKEYTDRTKEYNRSFGSDNPYQDYTFASENPIVAALLIIFIILFAIFSLMLC